MSDTTGSYTLMPLRALPQNSNAPATLEFLEYKDSLGYEVAKKVAIVNVRYHGDTGQWSVEYLDNANNRLLLSTHGSRIAKR